MGMAPFPVLIEHLLVLTETIVEHNYSKGMVNQGFPEASAGKAY